GVLPRIGVAFLLPLNYSPILGRTKSDKLWGEAPDSFRFTIQIRKRLIFRRIDKIKTRALLI
ncbi:hypothetical protein V6C27_14965, partial [Peptococcaceae bacterium 1198_IL3148]